jgi:membrane protein DedA with SNARE-associated domain
LAAILENLSEWIVGVIGALGYPGVFFLMLIENLLPPIPSEIVMPFSGFEAAVGHMTFFGVLLAGTLGSLLGAVIIYYVGALLGRQRLHRWIERWGRWVFFSADDFEKGLDFFDRHGHEAVLFGRLVPGVRSLISIPAGLDRMPLPAFLLYTTLGTLVWNTLLAGAGMLLGSNWHLVLDMVETYENVILAALVVVLVAYLIRRWLRRSQAASPAD